MAVSKKNLAFSNKSPRDAVSVLFAHRGESGARRTCRLHQHAFWQLEVMLEGEIALRLPGGVAHRFPAGRAILFPPGVSHGFDYPDSRVRWATFKFDAACPAVQAQPLWLQRSGCLALLVRCLVASVAEPRSRATAIQAGVLAAVLAGALPAAPPAATTELVRRAREAIESSQGRTLGVAELAAELHVSPGHLASLFRRETGGSLKRAIDEARTRRAVQLLTFTNLRIGEVAAELGFPDGCEFSRFIRRRAGRSPSGIRKSVDVSKTGAG